MVALCVLVLVPVALARVATWSTAPPDCGQVPGEWVTPRHPVVVANHTHAHTFSLVSNAHFAELITERTTGLTQHRGKPK